MWVDIDDLRADLQRLCRKLFRTYYTINGKKTVKTDKQIVKWLSSDNGDSAKYKMWGNGVALPNVIFVLSGIATLNLLEEENEEWREIQRRDYKKCENKFELR